MNGRACGLPRATTPQGSEPRRPGTREGNRPPVFEPIGENRDRIPVGGLFPLFADGLASVQGGEFLLRAEARESFFSPPGGIRHVRKGGILSVQKGGIRWAFETSSFDVATGAAMSCGLPRFKAHPRGVGTRLHVGKTRLKETDRKRINAGAQSADTNGRGEKEDTILRSISDNGEVSVLVADTTHLVREAARRHGTSPTPTSALGRLLTGAVLMGAFKAEGDAVQITFRGTGDIRQMTVIAESNGLVKGSIANPIVEPPPLPCGKLDVAGAIGNGVVTVVRSHPGQKRPYSGMTPIHSGEVAEDLAHYLSESEQVQSAIGLGVSLGKDGQVDAAGGWLVQVLPFASEETISALERNISHMPSPNELHAEGRSEAEITELLLEGIGVSPGAFHLKPKYGPCEIGNLKVRMKRAVALLGKEDVQNLIDEQDGVIEVTCEFCKDVVRFGGEEILQTLEEMHG